MLGAMGPALPCSGHGASTPASPVRATSQARAQKRRRRRGGGGGPTHTLLFEGDESHSSARVSANDWAAHEKGIRLGGSKLARLIMVSNRVAVPSHDGANYAGGLAVAVRWLLKHNGG